MVQWYKYILASAAIHVIVVALLLLSPSSTKPIDKPKQQDLSIRSYLVELPKIVLSEPEPAASSEIHFASEANANTSNPTVKSNAGVNESKPSEAILPEIDSKQESESRPEDQTPQIAEPAAQRLPSRYQLGNALKSIMRDKIGPSESWQSHQQTQFENKFKGNGGNPKLDDSYEFSASGSGVEVVAKSADGSHLVKMKGGCYSIGKDQWGDDLWTPTPCPNSADPYRKLLKESLQKYGLLKDK